MEESTPFDPVYWVSRAKRKYEDFGPLYDFYFDRIYRYFAFKVGRSHAEDLVQLTFIKAMNGLSSYREEALFSTWLFQIAKRVLLDENRRLQRRPKETELDIIRTELSEGHAERTEIQLDLLSAMQQLPEIEREIIMLRFFADCTLVEVAEILQMGESAVKNRLYRALEKMKGKLRGWGDMDERQQRQEKNRFV
ncbi:MULTISPECIES: RNA polymerase sigma factor [Brevibacillus]|uniref:RNA polymerase sigma factor n=1 Tax=Brevibacillus TaxID=55080 RepID=UPI0036281031